MKSKYDGIADDDLAITVATLALAGALRVTTTTGELEIRRQLIKGVADSPEFSKLVLGHTGGVTTEDIL
jgi:hypothetical protein